MNFASIKSTLTELKEVIYQLSNEEFTTPISSLSNASIGEHTRHIIELYTTVLTGYASGMLNYDLRERNKSIQNDKEVAILFIDQIITDVEKPNKSMVMEHQISGEITRIETNYFREILYNLEHCIHHQALIKVGIINFQNVSLSENFGIAPSTIEYRKVCAQ